MSIFRRWWIYPLIFVALIVLMFTVLQTGSQTSVDQSMEQFIGEVKAGRIDSVEIDGSNLKYRLRNDELTYQTEMEKGDTLGAVLDREGIRQTDPEYPTTEIRENSRWGNVLGLILNFLPIILIGWFIWFLVRRASRPQPPAVLGPQPDPVCGKSVHPGASHGSSTFQNVTYYFCSAEHKNEFDADPVRYLLKK